MARFPLLFAALIAALPAATALAQSSDCENFKVNAKLLNMRNTPDVFGSIVDVLSDAQIVCIGEVRNTTGQQWGNVVEKSAADGSATEAVNGWSNMRYLTPAAMATAPAAADPVPVDPVPVDPAPADTAAADPAPADPAAATGDTAPAAPQTASAEIPAFDEIWTTGPFPLQGRSLEQLANTIPLFPPIAGLPDEVWKQPCTGCHQWTQDRLCQQAQGYITNPANILRIQHPDGGIVKNALYQWANAGCE